MSKLTEIPEPIKEVFRNIAAWGTYTQADWEAINAYIAENYVSKEDVTKFALDWHREQLAEVIGEDYPYMGWVDWTDIEGQVRKGQNDLRAEQRKRAGL